MKTHKLLLLSALLFANTLAYVGANSPLDVKSKTTTDAITQAALPVDGSLRIFNKKQGLSATVNKPIKSVLYMYSLKEGNKQAPVIESHMYSIHLDGPQRIEEQGPREDMVIEVRPESVASNFELNYNKDKSVATWYGQSIKKMKQKDFLQTKLAHQAGFPPFNNLQGNLYKLPGYDVAAWYSYGYPNNKDYGAVSVQGIDNKTHTALSITATSAFKRLDELKEDMRTNIWPNVTTNISDESFFSKESRKELVPGISVEVPENFILKSDNNDVTSMAKELTGKVKGAFYLLESKNNDDARLMILIWRSNSNTEFDKHWRNVSAIFPDDIHQIAIAREHYKQGNAYMEELAKKNPGYFPYGFHPSFGPETTVWYLLNHAKGKLTLKDAYQGPNKPDKKRLLYDGSVTDPEYGFYYLKIYGVTDQEEKELNFTIMDKIIKSLQVSLDRVPYGAARI